MKMLHTNSKPRKLANQITIPIVLGCTGLIGALLCAPRISAQVQIADAETTIDINRDEVTGTVSPYIFGQNVEHEYGTINGGEQPGSNPHGLHSGGLWAEMLRDRKFEEGDDDQDGVANAWVSEERIKNRYWELKSGQGIGHRYFIDHRQFYGGGAAQAIQIDRSSASISQVFLQFSKGQKYAFYAYLKRLGRGTVRVDFEDSSGANYGHQEFPASEQWKKYTAEFTAPTATFWGRVRISAEGSGTFWIDSASLMPADNIHGMRPDVLDVLKPLRVPIIRYPGGCFADSYHWKDGIGPRDKRPERFSPFWNEWEPNDFGSDEFMEFVRETGVPDVHITTNYLMGTPQEAGEWAEYMNGSPKTPMGALRVQNGHAEPYHVRFWAVGNEAQNMCSREYFPANNVNEYATRYQQYQAAIKKADPTISMIAVGAPPGPLKWNGDVASLVSFDYLAASLYTSNGHPIDDFNTRIFDLDAFYKHEVGEPKSFADQLDNVVASMGDHFPKDRPSVAVTEFQSWWVSEKNDADFRLANALYLAGIYHELLRRSSKVAIAEIESLINVQGVVEVSTTSVKLTPEYFACLLYRNHTGTSVLRTTTKSSAVNFNKDLPAIDSQATLSADGKILYLSVINRSESNDLDGVVRLHGWTPANGLPMTLLELNGADKDAKNDFGSTKTVNIRTKSATATGSTFEYRFPAHSVTLFEIGGAG